MWDVVIIGGGIAGLSTGALLSKKGYRILLVEEKPHLGGRANCQLMHSGFIVDWGIHSLRAGEAGIAGQLFQELGLKLDVVPSGEGRLFHEGKWYSLPTSIQALMSTPLLTEEDRSVIGDLFGSIMSATPQELISTSVASWLEEQQVLTNIWWIFQLYSGLILIEPNVSIASMGEMLEIMHTILRSGKAAGYPKGGWRVILQALRREIERNGEIRMKASVTQIFVQKNQVNAVQIDDQRVYCDTIVAAVPPKALTSILPSKNAVARQLIQLADQLVPTAGVSIDMGFSEPITDAPGLLVSSEPFVIGQVTSNIDTTVAPPGKQLATFYYPQPADAIASKALTSRTLEQLETVIQRMFPDAPKPEWIRRLVLPVVDGAAPTIHQHREKRLPIQTEIKGLFLVGDAHNVPGAGGDIAFNSAIACAEKFSELSR